MPGFTMKKTTHCGMGDAIFSCQLCLRDVPCSIALSNLDHLSISQFSVGHSFTLLLAILGDFINHIVARSPQKEMGRIDAGGCIAVVQHAQIIGYGPEYQAVGDAMSKFILIAFLIDVKDAIAFRVFRRRPQPATICSLDMRPKSLGKRACFSRATTGATAILTTASNNDATFAKEGFATLLAIQADKWGHEYGKMVLHAKRILSCATPEGACYTAPVPFYSFSPIIPHLERMV